jgi:hypothetical protein
MQVHKYIQHMGVLRKEWHTYLAHHKLESELIIFITFKKEYSQPVAMTPEPEVDAAPAKRLWLPPKCCWLAAANPC